MDTWISVVKELERCRLPLPTLVDWLMQARPGHWIVVVCSTPTHKSNVQSRVNRIALTRRIKATATRTPDGVLVKRL